MGQKYSNQMERIEVLRQAALAERYTTAKFQYLFYKQYDCQATVEADKNAQSEAERYAAAFYQAFSELKPVIGDGERIVGRYDMDFTEAEQKEWKEIYQPVSRKWQKKAGGGQDSHMAIDYELLLHKGINGILAQIKEYAKAADAFQKNFYACCTLCLQAVLRHAEHYADHALLLSQSTEDPERRAELLQIAKICRRVPAEPAESFYEAVQSVHFVTYCISMNPFREGDQQFQLGRPDRYLLPYYEEDRKKGRLTREEAQLLLDCLGIQINMRVPNGLSSGYMVGGSNADGQTVANELTEMCMQVIDDIRLVYPAVGLCWTSDMPKQYLEKACSLLLKGYSHPAVFNDEVIVKGLLRYGVPKEQAHCYIHSTCVEITPVAASNVWVASPYTNLPQLLLDQMDQEYPDFAALLAAYLERLDRHIRKNFEQEMENRTTRAQNSMNPLVSCFVNDCLQRGLDIERGGAVYNWIMPSFVGMANLVDALYTVKVLVYEQKRLTLQEFKRILEQDFEGQEELQQYILHQLPKYGNDIDEIDRYFSEIAEHIAKECEKYTGAFEHSALIPSVFCWIMHERFGRDTGATPDGRRAGFPLGDGSGPCQGRESNGPTASILSSTKWDHSKFIGGVAVNLKFLKSSLGTDSLNTLETVLQVYLQRGGFEVQVNVVDNETLRKAQKNPEQYRDLVVRVGGYSDYFVKLSPQMQEEIILRTAHKL